MKLYEFISAGWDTVYRSLRAKFPDEHLHNSCTVTRVERGASSSGRVGIELESGARVSGDLLIGADG